jgi:hypothetical protein
MNKTLYVNFESNAKEIGTFHLRGLALQLSGNNPSFALQNTFHLR